LRLFNPQDGKAPEFVKKRREQIQHLKSESFQHESRKFATGSAALLVRRMDDSMQQDYQRSLDNLFNEAGELAVSLWEQRPAIKGLFLPELSRETYRVDSPVMQLHAMHHLDDNEDRRLDGKPIKIVVHPAILGMGTHDGEDYDLARVWAKAEVCLQL
jgi:hypothetical protein